MDASKQKALEQRMQRTIEALQKNHINASYAPTCAEAVRQVEELVPQGATVANGGSASLLESGVMDLMKSGRYQYIDRLKGEEETRLAHNADVFFMSSNAVTEHGELYNVDGNCNRISALAHGPKKVILIVGYNKIVPDLRTAVERVKTVAAPANGVRLGTHTPCAKTGRCIACGGPMTAGCSAPDRMCVNYMVTGYQRTQRLQVILVGEPLGY